MTNWTDLIDTDPVGAYKLWLEMPIAPPPGMCSTAQHPTDPKDLLRMITNLTALCERLTYKSYDDFSLRLQALIDETANERLAEMTVEQKDTFILQYLRWEIANTRGKDGSRRFPEVK